MPSLVVSGDGLAIRTTMRRSRSRGHKMIVTDFGEGDHPPALPAARTLSRFVTAAAAAIPLRGEVSILITGDRSIRRLNREFRNKNKPTDVLSFPAAKSGTIERIAGDLAISVDMASRQALALDHPLATELKVLILHGMLHLAGFDHEADKGEMAARELFLRRKFRLPGGLIERTEAVPAAVPRKKPVPRVSRLRPGTAKSTATKAAGKPSGKVAAR